LRPLSETARDFDFFCTAFVWTGLGRLLGLSGRLGSGWWRRAGDRFAVFVGLEAPAGGGGLAGACVAGEEAALALEGTDAFCDEVDIFGVVED